MPLYHPGLRSEKIITHRSGACICPLETVPGWEAGKRERHSKTARELPAEVQVSRRRGTLHEKKGFQPVNKIGTSVASLALFVIVCPLASGQAPPTPQQTHEANLKAYVGMLREDLKKDKVAILTQLMALGPEQAAKFWPVYNDYDKSLVKLADERIAFIRMYADNYSALSQETATQIAMGMLDVQARRLDLQKQYFQRFSQVLSPKDAARWLQIEAQIEKLVDLQILASLPIVE
jgi:hypothetical protein